MKVVFLEEVEGSGRIGDVRDVANGFARNYLLPRRLAAPATPHYISIAQARADKDARRQSRDDEEARQHLLPKVGGQTLTLEMRVGEQGKLFGSVTARDIAEELQRLTGIELEHRQIDLREPIRQLGSYSVTVKLTRNVTAAVQANVVALGGETPETEEAEAVEEALAEEAGEAEVAETGEARAEEVGPEEASGTEEAEAEEAKVEEAIAEGAGAEEEVAAKAKGKGPRKSRRTGAKAEKAEAPEESEQAEKAQQEESG